MTKNIISYAIKKPFDLLFYSDDEWNGDRSLVINVAKEEGEVIYG